MRLFPRSWTLAVRPYPQEKPHPLRQRPRRFGRLRTLGLAAVEQTCRWLGGRAFYRARQLRAGRLMLREERIPLARSQAGLAGLRIAHLSDLHAGPFLGPGDLCEVLHILREHAPHLIVFTGDFIAHRWTDALSILDDLAAHTAPLGSFAVFGNHDYRGRMEGHIAQAYLDRGIHFLRNEGVRLAFGEAHLCLVGVEDVEEARVVDLERARAQLVPGDFELVLCHNPMSAPIFARVGAQLILAGHTHGCQINLPWFGRLGPQHPGLRVEFGRSTLIVSRGLGVIGVPVRVRAPAEFVLIELQRGAHG